MFIFKALFPLLVIVVSLEIEIVDACLVHLPSCGAEYVLSSSIVADPYNPPSFPKNDCPQPTSTITIITTHFTYYVFHSSPLNFLKFLNIRLLKITERFFYFTHRNK